MFWPHFCYFYPIIKPGWNSPNTFKILQVVCSPKIYFVPSKKKYPLKKRVKMLYKHVPFAGLPCPTGRVGDVCCMRLLFRMVWYKCRMQHSPWLIWDVCCAQLCAAQHPLTWVWDPCYMHHGSLTGAACSAGPGSAGAGVTCGMCPREAGVDATCGWSGMWGSGLGKGEGDSHLMHKETVAFSFHFPWDWLDKLVFNRCFIQEWTSLQSFQWLWDRRKHITEEQFVWD